jgi:hypothetical protein
MHEKAEKKRQKKGGKKQQESLPAENTTGAESGGWIDSGMVAEEEEEEEEKIFLDYAIEDQLRQDVATAVQESLPALPEDMSTLPDLSSGDIKAGAIIACKFFDVNPITITPEISDYKTAVVDREGDSGNGAGTIRLKIADRDLPKREKKFDSHGNRIYDAADQFYMNEEGDDSLWEGQFGEFLEPKLVRAG